MQTENSALSSELPLLPEPETSQVSDSIRYGLEVKIAERNDLVTQPKVASHSTMKLSVCPRSTELLRVLSLIFCNFKMQMIMLPDRYYYQHYVFLGKPSAAPGTY